MKQWQKGFTLVEMLVVSAVVSLIAIASFNTINSSMAQARDRKRYKDLDTIEAALFAHYADRSEFPRTFIRTAAHLPGTVPASDEAWGARCGTSSGPNDEDGPNWIPGLSPEYISSLPQDPQKCAGPGDFDGYIYISDGIDFLLAADWMAEDGELCDQPGDKYYDQTRGPSQPFQGRFFCSIKSPGATNW